jgi:hypothetical protein
VQVPGKTYFTYCPFDSLAILHHQTLRGYGGEVDFEDFDSLLTAYLCDLKGQVDAICHSLANNFMQADAPAREGRDMDGRERVRA